MDLELEKIRDNLVITLVGELDLHTAEKFKERVKDNLNSNISNLILDLKEVKFIDSSGLGAILGLYKTIKNRDGRFIVMNLNNQVRRIFKLSGLLKLFEVAENN